MENEVCVGREAQEETSVSSWVFFYLQHQFFEGDLTMTKKDVIREELQGTEQTDQHTEKKKVLVVSHEENPRLMEVIERLKEKDIVVIPPTATSTEAMVNLPPTVAMSTLPYPDTRNHGPLLNPTRSKAMKKAMKMQRQSDRPSWRKP